MIHLYPANKMENLLAVLNKISELSPLGVFHKEVIIVQNAGMQHWLSLSIAEQRSISMNIDYALPAQFLWKLLRSLASEEKVPEQSPYSREVLTWRIYQLLASKSVVEDDDFTQATAYWANGQSSDDERQGQESLTNQTHNQADSPANNQAQLKRYQLAVQLADLYEQYLIFRPQWIDCWQRGEFNITGISDNVVAEHRWQGKLWQLLTQDQQYNPKELLTDAINNIASKTSLIPARISFFGLNTMAPMWLDLINAISDYVEVHFFHLNPCYSYWGDLITEKQALKTLANWANNENDIGNPLLANLGQQGREFINLIQNYSTVDVDIFEQAAVDNSNGDVKQQTILQAVQNDILTLSDARTSPRNDICDDDSIVITSCHSVLREVQGLHDYLLHQFNQDSELTPKDILVMCPQIEQYAPYVNAVFAKGWQDMPGDVPPLPCSIADRSAKDSDPIIATFIELLTLPDSRFAVSQLLSFLRLPAMADKFAIDNKDIDKISVWLQNASIHWGIDINHKQSVLGESANNAFTWQQGLSRLLRGFTGFDTDMVYQDQLLISQVEGSDAQLLGQLMLFIEQLQHFSLNLQKPRTAEQWQQFLLLELEQLFSRLSQSDISYEYSLLTIEKAIAGLVAHCEDANYQGTIELAIVVEYLTQHFSQGDAKNQFMVGQVTFCSMLPMRSIPFKFIAILGLNDGEFPRQRQPLGFDLMSLASSELGDRSRRGDDRYLFLEAIISARKSLYLSYQGRSIKNNSEKQPSLVIKELLEYINQGYHWHSQNINTNADTNTNNDNQSNNYLDNGVYQLPMQAFSLHNYSGKWQSFDEKWLALACSSLTEQDELLISSDRSNESELNELGLDELGQEKPESLALSADELISFYQNPAKSFAQHQLNLYFDDHSIVLDDIEPFTIDHLQSYLLRQELLAAVLEQKAMPEQATTSTNEACVDVINTAMLTGKFPDLPTTSEQIAGYVDEATQFVEQIEALGGDNPESITCIIESTITSNLFNQIANLPNSTQTAQTGQKRSEPLIEAKSYSNLIFNLTSNLAIKNNQLIHYRSSSAKAKDKFVMYLHQLIVQVWQDQQLASPANNQGEINNNLLDRETELLAQVSGSLGLFFDPTSKKVEQYTVSPIENAKQKLMSLLACFVIGADKPLLLNAVIAEQFYLEKSGELVEMTCERFEKLWSGDVNARGFKEDSYVNYFWPWCPSGVELKSVFDAIYHDLFQVVRKIKPSRAKKGAK